MIKKKDNRPSLFYSLADMLDQSHPLYLLADNEGDNRIITPPQYQ